METKLFVALASILAAFAWVGQFDADSEEGYDELYCEMVVIWNSKKRDGIPEFYRSGWPPYKGECDDDK